MSDLTLNEVLLDNLSTAVLLLDPSLKIVLANASSESLLEQSRNQLIDRPVTDFLLASSFDFERMKEAFVNRENYADSEIPLLFHDGRHCLSEVAISFFEHYNATLIVLEINPIDQQRKLSQENQQWTQQQAARELIRGLAHEIKNPLGGIRGAAQLLERELDNGSLSEFTQLIIEQSDRLRALVDRLLGPNTPPNFQWQNVHRVIEKIRALVEIENDRNVSIERDYDPSIPDMLIDQDMLQQALLNIARNALQALDGQGKLQFVTRVHRQITIHGKRFPLCAEIKIIDDGPGIPKELRDTLFYPMVTSKVDGSGLGLSIAQSLIEHHQGKIEVESYPGFTEFTIYLPIDKKDNDL